MAPWQKEVSLSKIQELVTEQSVGSGNDEPDPCFRPFISEGFVSLTGNSKDQKSVTILRDSAGSQSCIKEGILPVSHETWCHSSVLVRGLGMVNVCAPLHRVHFQCPLLSRWFDIAVLLALPVAGTDFLLGNDIAGRQVNPAPVIVDTHVVAEAATGSQVSPEVFPACAVTRAQRKKYGLNLSDSFLGAERSPEVVMTRSKSQPEAELADKEPSPSSPVSVKLLATREAFIATQKGDETLSKCLASVIGQDEAKRRKVAYVLDDDLLLFENVDCATY